MRILLVSGALGGSLRSQHELSRQLQLGGHDPALLIVRRRSLGVHYLYRRSINAYTKLGGSPLSAPVDAVARRLGARPRPLAGQRTYPVWDAVTVENALPRVLRRFSPDVVVVSSIDRVAWRRIRAGLRELGIPSVLYLREQPALGHLTISEAPPDLLLANSESLSQQARALGYECTTIPSVVILDDIRVVDRGSRVVMVSPTQLHGIDVAVGVATARPDVPFLLQESSLRLSKADWAALCARIAELPNVELRPFSSDPRTFFSEARILFAPHQVDNRPRVILEAQFNGIPVLGSAWPGIVEAVGAGGLVVPHNAPPEEWAAALGAIWDDGARWSALSEAASQHARRPDVDPQCIATRFEQEIAQVLQRFPARRRSPVTLDG